MPRPKLKTVSTIKPKGFAMNPGSKNIDSPGVFSLNNTNTISSLNPKKKTPTTTLKNALASDKDYEVVPGYEERLGGELKEVVVTASARNNTSDSGGALPTKRKKKKRKTYSKTGNFLRGINPLSTRHERVRARTRLGQDRLL